MKAIILRPTPDTIAKARQRIDNFEAICKRGYFDCAYTTDGEIEADADTVEDFIEECFDVSNNSSRSLEWDRSRRPVSVGDILVIVDIGGAYLCCGVGWLKIEN